MIRLKRNITEVKTQKKSTEISYYISNQDNNYLELCHAIRGHWSVEVNNHVRNVTFAEDDLTTKKTLSRSMAGLRTLASGILNQCKYSNKKAQLDNFADKFDELIQFLKSIKFL